MIEYNNIELVIYADTREDFESAKNSHTKIGIISGSGELWVNGAYYPIANLDNYIKKGDHVDFATDLTGVVEATAEEFVYRPSAGEKSIRDKSAVIRRIKGNSVVWEQKLLPLTSDNWTQYSTTYANIAFADNAATLTLTAAYTGQNVYNIGLKYNPPTTQKYLSGHVYLIVGLCKLQSGGQLMIEMSQQNFYSNNISASPNKWVSFSAICSLTSDWSTFYIKPPFSYTSLREGSSYSVSNVMLFDLTAMFGAGNEPAEGEDNDYMDKFLAIYNDVYYPYCDKPELRSMKTWAIKTVGFNLFNKNSAVVGVLTSTGNIDNTSSFAKGYFTARLKVLPNTTYYLLNVSNYYYYRSYVFYDAFGNVISSGGLQAPSSAYNASGTVTTPNNAAYMGVVVHNTFIDQCCINFSHSGVRDGEYEPYVLHTLELPEIVSLFPNGMHAVGDVFDEINTDTYIQRCEYRDYVVGDESNAEVLTDGKHTVVKLANPIVTPLSEPITLDYYCEDWGSEEAISAASSAPFRADIVYQFNAEGRIRDNGRNIERLENNIRSYNDDGVMVTINRGIITTKSIIGNSEFKYALPDAPQDVKDNAYGTLATETWVQKNMPTAVARAMTKETLAATDAPNEYYPNIVYEFTSSFTVLTIDRLIQPDGNYDHVWIIRFGCSSGTNLSITPKVYWKDGIEPIFGAWGICELKFYTHSAQGEFLGEWKIFRS